MRAFVTFALLIVATTAHADELALRQNDVVVFLGGEVVSQEAETGHLESLLTAALMKRGVRFRNMGWEGDTVFAQPRDVNFPKISQLLDREGATVVILQFGQCEALQGRGKVDEFVAAYEEFLDKLEGRRVVLITPFPFEKTGNPLLPDLSARNADLQLYVEAIRALGKRRNLPVADVFTELGAERERFTENGLRPSLRGQGLLAQAIARQLGLGNVARHTDGVGPRGEWKSQDFERLRQAVIAKNRLWFGYWRPTNWAFLGGDRVEQPSSRDHRDPKIRWFPEEMKEFLPLIEKAEARIGDLAQGVSKEKTK